MHLLCRHYQSAIRIESYFRHHMSAFYIGQWIKCIVCEIDLKATRFQQQLSLIHISFCKALLSELQFLFELELKLAKKSIWTNCVTRNVFLFYRLCDYFDGFIVTNSNNFRRTSVKVNGVYFFFQIALLKLCDVFHRILSLVNKIKSSW